MLHHTVKANGDHWATNHNSFGCVLVQLQDNGEQVRISLTPDQAEEFAQQILKISAIARTQESLEDFMIRNKLEI